MSYRTRDQLLSDFYSLETTFPSLISHESIGKSTGGRDIPLFKIGNSSGGRVLFVGGTHGDESTGPEVLNKYIHWLLERKESETSDRILSRNLTLIIPMFNIDNYRVTRKNLNGVDLNRNFPTGWGLCTSGSTDPTHWAYRGPSAGSEKETQAMLSAFQKWRPKFLLDYHQINGPAFGAPTSFAGVTVQDRAYHKAIATKIGCMLGSVYLCDNCVTSQRGVTPYSYWEFLGVCGPLIDDAYKVGGATAFLLEGHVNRESATPYADIDATYFPRFLPFSIALSSQCEVVPPPPPPQNQDTTIFFPWLMSWLARARERIAQIKNYRRF